MVASTQLACESFKTILCRKSLNMNRELFRLAGRGPKRSSFGISLCACPSVRRDADIRDCWPKTWGEVQYKPRNMLVHSIGVSTRDASLKLFTTPRRLPFLLDAFVAQAAVGVSASRRGQPCALHPVVQWTIQPRRSSRAAIKQQVLPYSDCRAVSRAQARKQVTCFTPDKIAPCQLQARGCVAMTFACLQVGGKGITLRNTCTTAFVLPEIQGCARLPQRFITGSHCA